MLDRQFLSTAGLSMNEFIQWVGAEKHELNAFENRLFEAAEIAGAVTGGDNEGLTADELRTYVDIGVRAEDNGLINKKDFENMERIRSAANDLIDSYQCDAIATIEAALTVVNQALKGARSDARRAELKDVKEQLTDLGKAAARLKSALDADYYG